MKSWYDGEYSFVCDWYLESRDVYLACSDGGCAWEMIIREDGLNCDVNCEGSVVEGFGCQPRRICGVPRKGLHSKKVSMYLWVG